MSPAGGWRDPQRRAMRIRAVRARPRVAHSVAYNVPMEARTARCDGCGGTIIKLGMQGRAPLHGKTLLCPKCGCAQPWDGTGLLTHRAHGFDRYGSYAGEAKPLQAGQDVTAGTGERTWR